MGEHTPGPWYLRDEGNSFHVLRKWGDNVRPENTNTYGSCWGAHIAEIRHQGESAEVVTHGQAEANANLIAAAPDLLQMLERIVNAGGWYMSALELEPGENGEDLEAEARKVLAKARGESNE